MNDSDAEIMGTTGLLRGGLNKPAGALWKRTGFVMRCPRQERIEQLAAGSKDPALLRVRAHVNQCPDCQRRLAEAAAKRQADADSPSPNGESKDSPPD